MKFCTFSKRAKDDLLEIGGYTSKTWGNLQAGLYLDQLEECCLKLAQDPGIGRRWPTAELELHRMEQGRHVIFYKQTDDGIFIYRILHQSMLPSLQPFEQAEPESSKRNNRKKSS